MGLKLLTLLPLPSKYLNDSHMSPFLAEICSQKKKYRISVKSMFSSLLILLSFLLGEISVVSLVWHFLAMLSYLSTHIHIIDFPVL